MKETDPAAGARALLSGLGGPALEAVQLGDWMLAQRWFSGKAREPGQISVIDAVAVSDGREPLVVLIVEVRSPAGTHDLYQLPVGISVGGHPQAIHSEGARTMYDAVADEAQMVALGRLMAEQQSVSQGTSTVRFHRGPGYSSPASSSGGWRSARALRGEQSNSSVVIDDRQVLKVFRRLEAGINPELEMVGFLTDHGFPHVAPVEGWYEYSGELLETTLGVAQRFLPGARDGWELSLQALRSGAGAELPGVLGELGAVTGRMHTTLASDPEDPEFAPEEPSDEHLALLTATIDEQIERLFVGMPEREELAPVLGRGEELRDRLGLLSHRGVGGRLIRTHGDYHLGQTLLGADGWVVLDFEGEPGRPLRERRRKRSPLRDVAGMLRSVAYAGLAGELLQDGPAIPEGWEERVRADFLEGYMAEIDPALLPAGAQAIEKQLAMFELEKVLYELRYELEHRPDWLVVPVSGIERLLAEPVG